MRTLPFLLCAAALLATSCLPAAAKRTPYERPTTFDDKIAELAKKHRIPERLIHRVIMRESRYAPSVVHRGNYGLMQIRYGTARTMGYQGSPDGLRDGITNLTFAVPYLANAYAVANHDEDRAVQLYASGFYYVAKRQGALGNLQIASYAAPEPEPTPVAPINPIAALFGALTAPAQTAVAAAKAESAAELAKIAAADASAQADDDGEVVDAPLPPRRPKAFSTPKFLQLAMRADERAEASAELRREQ